MDTLAIAFVNGGLPCGAGEVSNCQQRIGGRASVQLVGTAPPPTITMTIAPTSGPSGTSAVLTWTTTNASTCSLTEGAAAFPNVGTSSPSSGRSVRPTGAADTQFPYTLTCLSSDGQQATATANFAITAPATTSPPSLAYAPSPPGPIAYASNGTVPAIVVTPSRGAGAAVTTVGACSIVQSAAFPTQPSQTLLTFTGDTVTPQNLNLPNCVPQGSGATTASLTCTETGASAVPRTWQLTCPQAPNTSPTVQFNPAGGTLALNGTTTSIGGAATASFTATGSRASGAGTTTVSCVASPSTTFTLTPSSAQTLSVSNTSAPFTLGCQRGTTAVSGTATCSTTRNDGSAASAGSASYTLSCPAALNAPPTGTPTTITGRVGDPLSATFVASDPDGGQLTVAVTQQPAQQSGLLTVSPTVNAGGVVTVTFIPAANVNGPITGQGTVTLTDSAGASGTVPITLNIAERNASSSVGGGTPAAEAAIATSLETSTASLNDPVVSAAVDPTANLCADRQAATTASLNSVCTAITGASQTGNSDVVGQALLALDASERSGASAAAMDVYRQRTSAIVGRMTEIRSTGGRGMSLAGLTIMDGYSSIPVSMLVGAADAAFGLSAAEQAPDDSLASESNWGFFLTGTYARQDKDASNSNGQAKIGYTLDGYNISTGFDYRFNTSAVLGLALNFADSKTEFDGEDSGLDSTSQSLTIYGTLIGKTGGYLDAAVSFGSLEFDQDRLLDFTSLGLQEYRNGGSSDGDERAFVLNLGKPWRTVGQFTLTPSIGYSYSTVDINSFTETDQSSAGSGTNVFLLHYDDTTVNSSLANLSLRAERTWNWAERSALVGWQGSLTGYKEFQGDGASIVPTFPLLGDIPFGVIDLDEADTQYFLVDTGLTYASPAGLQLFFSVGAYLGIEDTSRYYFNVGGRYDF